MSGSDRRLTVLKLGKPNRATEARVFTPSPRSALAAYRLGLNVGYPLPASLKPTFRDLVATGQGRFAGNTTSIMDLCPCAVLPGAGPFLPWVTIAFRVKARWVTSLGCARAESANRVTGRPPWRLSARTITCQWLGSLRRRRGRFRRLGGLDLLKYFVHRGQRRTIAPRRRDSGSITKPR
jgi:hypothetical protein